MKHIEYKDLKIGDEVYMLCDDRGMYFLRHLRLTRQPENCNFAYFRELDSRFELDFYMSDLQRAEFYKTKEHGEFAIYCHKRQRIKMNIASLEIKKLEIDMEISAENVRIAKLNEQYSYLHESNPEFFI